ncbi:hypothetical protein [Adhaeretor mobilis]|uniref:Uncharacterized protein n=1 Tax=Adhaeretor mobilis TaxID=1930276 RepID=A0A517N220_9BACT|nr:hypothetical protein [Adhaeretor mobilis]QDT01174.1 hypothetical protein HG15A2_45160 [Adhaeretor mobilis]
MNSQYALLAKDRVPSRDEWQKSIDNCGFDFQIDPELKPFEDSGYLPCKLSGKDAGFEIYYDTSPETLAQFSSIAPSASCSIEFGWGGEMIECASAMIASYSLAKDFGAIVSYEGEKPYQDLEPFLNDTNAIIEDAMK